MSKETLDSSARAADRVTLRDINRQVAESAEIFMGG